MKFGPAIAKIYEIRKDTITLKKSDSDVSLLCVRHT